MSPKAALFVLASVVLFGLPLQAKGGQSLGQQRVAAARQAYQTASAQLTAGRGQPDTVYVWSLRWLTAQREHKPARARAALQAHLERMTQLQAQIARMVKQGALPTASRQAAAYYVLEARFWLAQLPKR